MMVLVSVRGLLGRVGLALLLCALAYSERYARERGLRHKKVTEWAWQLLLSVRRWYPEREIVAMANTQGSGAARRASWSRKPRPTVRDVPGWYEGNRGLKKRLLASRCRRARRQESRAPSWNGQPTRSEWLESSQRAGSVILWAGLPVTISSDMLNSYNVVF